MHLRAKFEWLLLALAAFVCVASATYKLTESPPIWYDEGFYSQLGINLALHGQQVIQVAPSTFVHSAQSTTVGYPLLYPLSVSYSLFGIGVPQGRGVMVVYIIAFALAAYVLTRRLYGSTTSAWSVLLLVSFAMIYGNGKTILGEVPALFFFSLSLLALLNLERTHYKDWRAYAWLGLLVGLCVSAKISFVLLGGAVAIVFVLNMRRIPLRAWGVVAGACAFLVPMLFWFWTQLDPHTSVTGLFAQYANPYAVTNMQALMIANARRFVTEVTPIYTLLLMIVWGASLYVRRKHTTFTEATAFVFCILTLLAYLRLEGWYRYFFPATTVALLFFPQACIALYTYAREHVTPLRTYNWLPYACVAMLFVFQVYQILHSSFVADYYHSTETEELESFFVAVPPTTTYFIYNVPQLVEVLHSTKYYQYVAPAPKIHIGEDQLPVLAAGKADVVVVGDGEYGQNPQLFTHYTLWKQIGHYTILKKT